MAKWAEYLSGATFGGGYGRAALGLLTGGLSEGLGVGAAMGVSEAEENRRSRRRKAAEGRAGSYGDDIRAAGLEEDRLREATISRLKAREERAETEGEDMVRDLRAEMGKVSAKAHGRQAGKAMGGGMLASLSGVEMDLERQGREIKREAADRASGYALDRLAFERGSMKTQADLREEKGELKETAKTLLSGAKTAGYIDESLLQTNLDKYIKTNGLSSSQAGALRDEVDSLVDSDSWLPFV